MTPFDPNNFDRDGNLIVPRYGIRIAMTAALVAACTFTLLSYLADKHWHRQHPGSAVPFADPFWMLVLWTCLPLVPFIMSGVLLSFRAEEAVAAGAGISAALFLCSLLFSIAAAAGFVFFGPEGYSFATAISILTFVVCSVWIIVSAFRIGAKASWGIFFLAAGITLFSLAVAYHWLEWKDYQLDRQRELQKSRARIEVRSIVLNSVSL